MIETTTHRTACSRQQKLDVLMGRSYMVAQRRPMVSKVSK